MIARSDEPLSDVATRGRFLVPIALAVITLVARVLTSGPLYFADGPAHIKAILQKVYIIQPPGYWLFNRTAGLFPNPVIAITVMNIIFSVVGVIVFYQTALFFGSRRNAFIAALAYSSIFYIWFSGEVHSTYASQALFPVLTFWALLSYERTTQIWRLCVAASTFAVGAGLRPSDGVFLIPMLMYYSKVRLPRKKAIQFLVLILLLCLVWVIPTGLAYRHAFGGIRGAIDYTQAIIRVRSITQGVNSGSMANIARYVLPLLVAFWPVLTIAILHMYRNWEDWRIRMILLWVLPGSLFFIFSYISDAPYLNFLSAAVLLLAVSAPRLMTVTALWNTVLFLFFIVIPSQRLLVNTWNCDIGKYTFYAIHRQWQPNLSQVQTRLPGNIGEKNSN